MEPSEENAEPPCQKEQPSKIPLSIFILFLSFYSLEILVGILRPIFKRHWICFILQKRCRDKKDNENHFIGSLSQVFLAAERIVYNCETSPFASHFLFYFNIYGSSLLNRRYAIKRRDIKCAIYFGVPCTRQQRIEKFYFEKTKKNVIGPLMDGTESRTLHIK